MDGHIRLKKRRQSRMERVGVALAVLTILGVAGFILWANQQTLPPPPPVEDRAAEVADILPFSELVPVRDLGWVAVLPPTYAGRSDTLVIERACEVALRRLGGTPTQTLQIMRGEEFPSVECGESLQRAPAGPRATSSAAAAPAAAAPAAPSAALPPPAP